MAIWVLRALEYGILFVVLYFTVVMLLLYLTNRSRMADSGGKAKKNPRFINYEPTVSFVIPAHNEEKMVGQCLDSLINLDYPKKKVEIIVINDESTDRTQEIVEGYKKKGVVLINNEKNLGKADSQNLAISKAKGDVIITLDADTYVTKDSLKKVMGYFDEDVAAVTSAVKVKEKKKMNFIEKLQRTEYLFTIFNRRIFSFINSVYVTPGPFSAFRKEVFEELGGFDPKFLMEDQEIALRIQSADYRIESCIDAVVYSEVPETFGDLLKQRIRWHRGGLRNVLHYSFLVNPKYGDFGVFVMPYSIMAIFLLAIVAMLVGSAILVPKTFNFINPLLLIEPLHMVSLTVLGLTVLWTYVALRGMGDKVDLKYLVFYVLGYAYMITLFMVIAVYKEVKGDERTWYNG